MKIDWSKAPVGTTGAMVADFNGATVKRGEIEWIPSSITPKDRYQVGAGAWVYHEAPQPWDGEGLPPVGTEVEVHRGKCVWIEKDEWRIGKTAKVMSSFENSFELGMAAIQFESGHCECILAECLRPIRTAEQIEEDQKKQEVKELMIILGSVESAAYKDIAIAIQQANFRKQVSQ
ncbi:hypothetical protein [Pseudomonas savastanoi]|uniref:hypothetical protein n=1 Tax=Pseudomonas savastanoi TaxID=29438 RepID=UPI0009B34D09|nr:hypothetical protein [Pseudomonas savastanoi]